MSQFARVYLLIAALCFGVASTAHARPYTWFAAANATASLTTSYSCTEIDGDGTLDSLARPVPASSYLSVLHADLASVSTAASIDWFIAQDSGGDNAITDIVNESIVDHDSDNAGTAATVVNTYYAESGLSTKGSLWVCAKTNAGTATATFRLFGQEVAR